MVVVGTASSPRFILPMTNKIFCSRSVQVKIYFALMHLHPLDVRITYRGTPGSDVQDAEELTLSTMAQLNDARCADDKNSLHGACCVCLFLVFLRSCIISDRRCWCGRGVCRCSVWQFLVWICDFDRAGRGRRAETLKLKVCVLKLTRASSR